MKIYTKTGDTGDTGLWGGQRVPKDHLRVHAYGTVDECNAVIGLTRSTSLETNLDGLLKKIQNQLFILGADLANPSNQTSIERIGEREIHFLEEAIDEIETHLPTLKQFILPGGTPSSAYLHLARAVCRRAEREVVTLACQETLNPQTLIYLNRLSDFLFVATRWANHLAQVEDIPWIKPDTQIED